MSIKLKFKLTTFQPGSRGYNQAIFEPVNNCVVSIDIPLKHEYIANAEEIIMAETGFANKVPEPVLTVRGWAYIENQLLDRSKEEAIKYSDEDFE